MDNPIPVVNEEIASRTEAILQQETSGNSSKKSLFILFLVFMLALVAMFLVYQTLPNFDEDERKALKLPREIEDAKSLGRVLSKYKETHFVSVIIGFFFTYIFPHIYVPSLQSFAIPGSIFLSILSGFLFPFYLAIFLVCLASATGASFCYLLSHFCGKSFVWKHIPQRALEWSDRVHRHSDSLLNYMIFLRITPLLPNWFINIVSPIINVPLPTFFFGTFLGVAPPSFVAIQAGTTLHTMTSSNETLSVTSIVVLTVLALLSVLPVVFKNKLKQKFD